MQIRLRTFAICILQCPAAVTSGQQDVVYASLQPAWLMRCLTSTPVIWANWLPLFHACTQEVGVIANDRLSKRQTIIGSDYNCSRKLGNSMWAQ